MSQYFTPVAIGALVIVAIVAIAFNPSFTGVLYALVVIVGACTVWLLRQLYLAESERRDD
jgi:Flp pilus assembly protein TadB